MIRFLSLASGSKGNATLIYDEKTTLLFDMGITKTLLKEGLAKISRSIGDLSAVFITHEHHDHIAGLPYVKGVPLYASPSTLSEAERQKIGETIEIGSFKVRSFSTHHDAANPVGYDIENGDTRLVLITDTGYLNKNDLKKVKNATYYILESNHDLEMLLTSSRPVYLKQRIAGKKGHLSNDQSALYSLDLIGERTKAFYLCHRSEECNTREATLATYREIYEEYGVPFDSVSFVLLEQRSMTPGGDL